ncbi:MAG TPA: HD domain-containing phosphohydrolase [Abditibacteriaceae bacterium]|nr:HD domain-containing phosphohydrolase [Abditibacteriaceae bacterium]
MKQSQNESDARNLPDLSRPLTSLDEARQRVLDLHNATQLCLQDARDTAKHAQETVAQARLAAAKLEQQHAYLHTQYQQLKDIHQQLHNEFQQLRTQHQQLNDEHQKLNDKHACLSAEREQLQGERDKWRAECTQSSERNRQLEAQLAEQVQQKTAIQRELLELYRDLRADDLPSLILRIGVKLTGAEAGLYVDGSGDKTLADIGLEALPDSVTKALCEFTRQVAQSEEPLVRNDTDNLPEGSNLINLAALPVAVQGHLKGVLLVANKRSGDFSDDDTELLLSIGSHAGVALENNRLHCELAENFLATIAVLADAIKAKDPYTRGHCDSVAEIAVRIAQKLGWNHEEMETLRLAALLHDIGKIGIPDGILMKPGRLLPEEYLVIQRHSLIGSDLVCRVRALEKVAPIILHHHERMDGGGYPDGLHGEEIALAARIIGVVDAYDAMTSPRPYRDAISPREALEELRRCAGSQFDAHIVDIIHNVLEERSQETSTTSATEIISQQ